jgi:hypothetical protein
MANSVRQGLLVKYHFTPKVGPICPTCALLSRLLLIFLTGPLSRRRGRRRRTCAARTSGEYAPQLVLPPDPSSRHQRLLVFSAMATAGLLAPAREAAELNPCAPAATRMSPPVHRPSQERVGELGPDCHERGRAQPRLPLQAADHHAMWQGARPRLDVDEAGGSACAGSRPAAARAPGGGVHYRRQLLPRVPNALGEGPKTLGEAFPECNTRGRASGDASHGKEAFPECIWPAGR